MLCYAMLCYAMLAIHAPIMAQDPPNIVGGRNTNSYQAPYMAALNEYSDLALCGCSIISDRWILTAAHCITHNNYLSVHLGSTTRFNFNGSSYAQNFEITADNAHVIKHPNYNASTWENDIALIQLSQPIQFNEQAMPIEYANQYNTSISNVSSGQIALLTGWGETCPNCIDPQFLQGVSMPLISRNEAFNRFITPPLGNPRYTRAISDNMLAFYQLGQGVGFGDSGGPSVINKNGNKINIGVASWGYRPFNGGLPSIYTNIRNYAPWIESVTGISNTKQGVDLYIKDKRWDVGTEPSNVEYAWESDDIWVRNQNDALPDAHLNENALDSDNNNDQQNPIGGRVNYVYVRVRNRGSVTSPVGAKVKLYWTKASTAIGWPDSWNGRRSVQGRSLGNIIDEASIPPTAPGGGTILTFPWIAPDPRDYIGLSNDPIMPVGEPHHFCLLARIEAQEDPMTTPEVSDIGYNTGYNNNIAWKNLSIVPPPGIVQGGGGDVGISSVDVLVGDAWGGGTYDLEFTNPKNYEGNPITKEAEVTVTLDANIWAKWQQGGFQQANIKILNADKHQILVTGEQAFLRNMAFQANEQYLLGMKFNFLTKEVSDKNDFRFDVIQRKSSDQTILGGEQFLIQKRYRNPFTANAGDDKELRRLATVTLSAYNIGEQAVYNWYDESGNLVYTGKDFTVSPEVTTKYKLEIIANADGFKDYDEVRVRVKEFAITNVSPNPSNTFINVDYRCPRANSAYLMIVPTISGTSHQYILDTNLSTKNIDVSTYPSGQYAVILVCNGNIVDYQSLFIN
jgi:Trypsin